MDRLARAKLEADTFIELHKRITELDELGRHKDLLDHLARKARLAAAEARLAAAESRR